MHHPVVGLSGSRNPIASRISLSFAYILQLLRTGQLWRESLSFLSGDEQFVADDHHRVERFSDLNPTVGIVTRV